MDDAPRRSRHSALRALGWWAAAVLTAGGALAAWWTLTPPDRPELEPDWRAVVFSLAGDGVPGPRDGQGSAARFLEPYGIAAGADGTAYVSDAGLDGARIRTVSSGGVVATIAGGRPGFADGPGSAARFDSPSGLALGADGTLYIADTGTTAIRRLTPDGIVSTVAGGGGAGYRDGPGPEARFNGPVGIAVDAAGRLIVADTYNDRIRAIAPDGTVTTIAGAGVPGVDDGDAMRAKFDTPAAVAVGRDGTIFVADTGNRAVRTLTTDGRVDTLPTDAPFGRLLGIAAGPEGRVYVTDDRGAVYEVRRDGEARLLAGGAPGFRDGPGGEARFRRPSGVAFVSPGRLLVADAGNALVRAVAASALAELRTPPSPLIRPEFDYAAFARLPLLWPVAPMEGPFEIAGTAGEARGTEGAERFHAGIDVRAEAGTPVHAVRDGLVSSPVSADDFGSVNEWIRVGAVTYVHVRAGRDRAGHVLDPNRFVATYDAAGKLTRVRVKRGARFAAGEVIASVNPFNHVHLNVGWPGEEHNPLELRLVNFEDTIPPAIARGGIRLYDESGRPLAKRVRGRLLVSGRVQIVVDAWDRADGNRPGRRLGLYALGYQVLGPDGRPAPGFEEPRETLTFNRLAGDPDAPRRVYAPGSGIPYYGRRTTRFLYSVTTTFRDGVAEPGSWDTTQLPPGDYTLRIVARDIRGNSAVTNRDLPVTIEAPPE